MECRIIPVGAKAIDPRLNPAPRSILAVAALDLLSVLRESSAFSAVKVSARIALLFHKAAE